MVTDAGSSIPQQIYDLRAAIDLFDLYSAPNNDKSDLKLRIYVATGAIVYMGIHFESSMTTDIAVSTSCTSGDANPDELTALFLGHFLFGRGVSSADVSTLPGFVFKSTPGHVERGSLSLTVILKPSKVFALIFFSLIRPI